jgi:hypothetical protein
LGTKNNKTLPLDFVRLECLSVQSLVGLPYVVATQFTIKTLEDLTHMLCFLIPCHKLYKEGVLFYVFTLKYTCHFGMNSKKLNPKGNLKK